MAEIKELVKDGFALDDTSLALLSLKISLRAYFSTYESMSYSLHVFSPDTKHTNDIDIDRLHSSTYVEHCSEAILHFHHFVELVIKDVLRSEHPFLADFTSSRHHTVLHKLISGEQISEDEKNKLQSIEFREALGRLCALVKNKRINTFKQWDFVRTASDWLGQINHLRNRLIHRGIFVLRYPSLDKIFGEFILPFILNVVSIDKYSEKIKYWKYGDLDCGIDPIELIIDECKNEKYDIGKVAFLKELGRAAFEQPYGLYNKSKENDKRNNFPLFFDTERINRAERIAKSEISNVSDVRSCPVCGTSSLVVYDDINVEGEDYLEGTYEKAWRYTWEVKCMCCTFLVNHHLKNPQEYDILINDFWMSEELI